MLLPLFFHHEAFRGHQKATQDVLISNSLVGVTRIFFVRTATNPQWNPSSTTSFLGVGKTSTHLLRGGEGAGSGSVRPEFARAGSLDRFPGWGFAGVKNYHWPLGYEIIGGREFSVVGLVWWCGFEEISQFG